VPIRQSKDSEPNVKEGELRSAVNWEGASKQNFTKQGLGAN
jgi:hypothetical protein